MKKIKSQPWFKEWIQHAIRTEEYQRKHAAKFGEAALRSACKRFNVDIFDENKANERCFAVGDIHGHSAALKALLKRLTDEAKLSESDTLIFLGDYVDRGPDDEGVLELLKDLTHHRPSTVALLGNHDSWRSSGTVGTRMSQWLHSLPHTFRWKNYFFSHAPVYRIPNARVLKYLPTHLWEGLQTFEDAIHSRYDFLNSFEGFEAEDLLKEEGVIGVCGHIHHPEVKIYPGHYIDVDTGCGFGGQLSAIELPSQRVWSVPETGEAPGGA
jgi:serine/threonine protein phosphatase 1